MLNLPRIALALALLAATNPIAHAQKPAIRAAASAAAPAAANLQSDQAKFDAVLGQAAKFLAAQPAYAVTVQSNWTTSGGGEGKNAYWLTVQRPGKFRVEVQSGTGKTPELLCVSDGAKETTLLTTRNLYSRLPAAASGLQRNKLLGMSLAGSGLDVLMQPNVVAAVNSQVSDVKYLGMSHVEEIPTHGFQMRWAGQVVQLYFVAQGDPLLKQFVRRTEVATGADTKFEMEATATLTWKLGQQPAPETFALSIPENATKVHDIYDALAGDQQSPVGQPLPTVEIVQLDGSRANLTAVANKPATVLIFWATWAAPSVSDMPAVTEFVAGLHAKGIGIYAVNVGEPLSEVRRFATKHGLEKAVVIDASGDLACELQIDDLPAAVVLDSEGRVHSVLTGQVAELKAGLGKELATLVPAAFNGSQKPEGGTSGGTAQKPLQPPKKRGF